MGIATIFACVSCRHMRVSRPWYETLFGRPPLRQPSPQIAEWQFSESAEVQLCEQPADAGHGRLVLGVLPLQQEWDRLAAAGLGPGPIEETEGYFVARLDDPDGNRIVLASMRRD